MSSNRFETLLLDVENNVAILTINRPKKLNALNNQVLDELDAAIDDIAKRDDVRGVIITGSGDRAFVAGADIAELEQLNEKTGREASRKGQEIFSKIENLAKPVIAVVNGYALGGGCELAMACHLRVATQNAKFGLPEVGLGLIPGYGGTQRLTRLIGKGRALEMILTANHVNADLALAMGLVNRLAADGQGMKEANELISVILGKGPVAIKQAIQSVHAAYGDPDKGFKREAELFGELFNTEDFKEGTSAFMNKRSPNFTGK
ncbi:MAG TPA: enoyl-CoA hydratase-related protein [Balneolales bacterium]|nr:enoyl-CoA hydratase-related protein [Balneolales bacterium]